MASALGFHVTKRPTTIVGHVPISDPPTPPDPVTTPPGSLTTGAVSHAGPSSQEPLNQSQEEGIGGGVQPLELQALSALQLR